MRLPLTALLLRINATPVSALSEASRECMELHLWSGGKLERIAPEDAELSSIARADELVIALFDRATEPPAWQQFLAHALGVAYFSGTPASRGAIVFCPVDSAGGRRWLAWCFGSGWRSLRLAATDSRFGLVVALNALAVLAEDSAAGESAAQGTTKPYVRDVATRSMLGPRQRSSHRAARNIPPEAFGVDRRSQVIALVGGRSHDSLLGMVKGGRSLAFRGHLECIEDLMVLSSQLLERAGSDRYKATFGWVDRLTLVDDDNLRQSLTEQLAEELLTDHHQHDVDVILPDDLLEDEDDRSIAYVLLPGQRKQSAWEGTGLTVARLTALIEDQPDPGERVGILHWSLRFLDDAGVKIGTATILECLAADLTHRGERYVLHEGDFYRVEESIVEEVDHELRDLVRESSIPFPCCHSGPERRYNERAAEGDPPRFLCLDNEFLYLQGQAPVELCDLFADTGALVYVKRKGRSSVLSHLFLQAANACDLLRHSQTARQRLAELIHARTAAPSLVEASKKTLASLERRDGGPEVVFAFLEVRSNRITDLPLFSKVSLVHVALTLSRLGYQPSYKLVKTCDTFHRHGERVWI